MRFVRKCSAVALAAVCVAGSSAPAGAEEPLHQVTYSVFSELPFRAADIYYRDTEPANWSDYSHDPYVFSPKVEADIGPTKKWVLNVQLANPDEWAMVAATSGLSPTPPNVHCVLAVDGVVVAENSGPKGALCSLRHW
ncbi:hypothetical protein ACRDU6_12535 [Mycolicibacterium sp. ELW1]|uniref:hypothetical protein n=1 Tax=Mycobacteriaceae TaxID=1762 RepID=UPI0011EBEF32|nr:hypothetical protein [Mycobacterium sp. ELW1]QEN13387.1 hypothetical protein D3H54_09095 [Mycobacterium sp. ELW1]